MAQPPQSHPEHDPVAFAIGQDHARHGLVPPPDCRTPGHPVRQGWAQGLHRAAASTEARGAVRRWLALRLQAWRQGAAFEPLLLTPRYLQQLAAPCCPVTRMPLSWAGEAGEAEEPAAPDEMRSLPTERAVHVRLLPGAGYAAGHLAVLSASAAQALADLSHWRQAWERAEALHRTPPAETPMTSAAWRRLAVLMAMVQPGDEDGASAALPLCVLPPNRLRVLSPWLGLQAVLTHHRLIAPRPARDAGAVPLRHWAAGLPADLGQRPLARLLQAMAPHGEATLGMTRSCARRRAEDAWTDPRLLHRWQALALRLDAEQTEALLQAAWALGLAGGQAQWHPPTQAVDGWGEAAAPQAVGIRPRLRAAPAGHAAAPWTHRPRTAEDRSPLRRG